MEWKLEHFGGEIHAEFLKGGKYFEARLQLRETFALQNRQKNVIKALSWEVRRRVRGKYELVESGQGTTLLQTLQEIESKWGNQ